MLQRMHVVEGDVPGVGSGVYGDAGGTSLDAHPGRIDHRRNRAAAAVAQRGDLVDVDGEFGHGYLTAFGKRPSAFVIDTAVGIRPSAFT
jgi:hypothetical protein